MIRGEQNNGIIPFPSRLDDVDDLADLVVDKRTATAVIGAYLGCLLFVTAYFRLAHKSVRNAARAVGICTLHRRQGRLHILTGIHTCVGLGGVPGLVGATKADVTEPRLISVIIFKKFPAVLAHVNIVIILIRQGRRLGKGCFAASVDIRAKGIQQALLAPLLRHVCTGSKAGVRTCNFVYLVKTVGVDDRLALYYVATAAVQVRFTYQRGAVAKIFYFLAPDIRVGRQNKFFVIPRARGVCVLARKQGNAGRHAKRCRCGALSKHNTLACYFVKMLGVCLTAHAAHNVAAELVSHQKQNVGSASVAHTSSFGAVFADSLPFLSIERYIR